MPFAAPAVRLGLSSPEVITCLLEGDFERLDSFFAEIQSRFGREPARVEHEMELAVRAFRGDQPTLESALLAWKRARPDSAFAHLAYARYKWGEAGRARGTKYANQTPRANFEAMRTEIATARDEARLALERDPALIEGYAILMSIATMASADELGPYRQGLRVFPASYRLRSERLQALRPRWGGSRRAMAEEAERAQSERESNPRLVVLRGFVHWDHSVSLREAGESEAALAEADRALAFGEEFSFHQARGDALQKLRRNQEAVDAFDRSLYLLPDNPTVLAERGWSRAVVGDLSGAERDLSLLRSLEPDNPRIAGVEKAITTARSRRSPKPAR